MFLRLYLFVCCMGTLGWATEQLVRQLVTTFPSFIVGLCVQSAGYSEINTTAHLPSSIVPLRGEVNTLLQCSSQLCGDRGPLCLFLAQLLEHDPNTVAWMDGRVMDGCTYGRLAGWKPGQKLCVKTF